MSPDHPSGAGGEFDDEDGDWTEDELFDALSDALGDEEDDWTTEVSSEGPISKPDELLALHGVTTELFETLKRWFDVRDSVPLDLTEVDSAVAELGDPQMVAALAMRKLQALHLLATPGVRTATDVVVSIVNDLERAMIQAPNMWLKRRAATIDWDRAFEDMASMSDDELAEAVPVEAHDVDPEVLRFRTLHGLLHDAMFAVIEVSDGEIRELE
ncbi:MAG: hypothetical protein ABI239_04850 [Aquihabitans sp.]